jgi:hypothetical protein
MPLDKHMRDVMKRVHAKFHEFSMHRDADINLSLFSFSKFCTQQELSIFDYMKDVVLNEGIPTKSTLYFSELYFYLLLIFKFHELTSITRKQVTHLLY